MYRILKLYTKPYDKRFPVVCFDEKSKQLLAHIRKSIPMKPGSVEKYNYEYIRNGTCNIFTAEIVDKILKKTTFIYTPKHASWLNMAEIEINMMSRECIGRNIGSQNEILHVIPLAVNLRFCVASSDTGIFI